MKEIRKKEDKIKGQDTGQTVSGNVFNINQPLQDTI